MIELAKQIFTEEGLIALVLIGVLIIAGLMAYTLYILVRDRKSESKTVLTQAEVISQVVQQLVTPVKEISDSLMSVTQAQAIISQNLLKVAELLNTHDQRVVEFREALDSAVLTMRDSVKQRNQQIDDLPGKVLETMSPELEKIPKAIEAALTPKIEQLQADIAAMLKNVAEQIPERTAEKMRGELADLQLRINASLREMIETAMKETADSIRAAEDSAALSEEKKPDGTE